MAETFNPMDTAPKDGTPVRLKVRHDNWKYAAEDQKAQWEAVVVAKWIDFNGGGWTWHGLCGRFLGWLPARPEDTAAAERLG